MSVITHLPVLPLDRRLCIPLVHADDVADALGARAVHLPSAVLGRLVDLSWRARLQPIDRGRARTELGWQPRWSAAEALRDVLGGVADGAHTVSPPLRRRSPVEQLRRSVTVGAKTVRHLP